MSNSPTSDPRDPTPLALIRRRFTGLAARPVRGLPPGWDGMRAGRLAERLLDPQIPAEQVDAVWARLIEQARTRDETAVLLCMGAALPMLSAIASKLCGHWAYRADTEAMVLVAFLDAVSGLDVSRPNVAYRLRWATFHRACPPVRERKAAPTPIDWVPEGGPSSGDGKAVCSPSGHPELLLALAVDEGVLTAADASLILDTRLHPRRLKIVAAEAGIAYAGLAKRRRRAELRLAAWLRERIADTQACTRVEIAALDALSHTGDHPDRRTARTSMSNNRSAVRVLPLPKPAPSPVHTERQEPRRCA